MRRKQVWFGLLICFVVSCGALSAAEKATITPPFDESLKGVAGVLYQGDIDVAVFLQFMSGYRGAPILYDASNAAFESTITIVHDMPATYDIVKAILEANGFTVTERILSDGTEVIDVAAKTYRPKGPPRLIVLDDEEEKDPGPPPEIKVEVRSRVTIKDQSVSEPGEIPIPKALDDASIQVKTLATLTEDALLIGNGDVNGLVTARGRTVSVMLTKNDVWDARLDTKLDPPIPTLSRIKELASGGGWRNKTQVLPEGSTWKGPDSYHAHPYPCPRACARLILGDTPQTASWQHIRAEGTSNEWIYKENVAVMRIEGKTGASNGWRYSPLSLATAKYPSLNVSVEGTKNARFFIDIMDAENNVIFQSLWRDTPHSKETFEFALPEEKTIVSLILYTWTSDGKPAENRFSSVVFKGPHGEFPIDLSSVKGTSSPGHLDIRKAVVHVEGQDDGPPAATIRALAQRNVFLIESDAGAWIEAVQSDDLPPAEKGTEKEVGWIKQTIPGDADWPGMSFAVALAGKGRIKAVSIVTSREERNCVQEAVERAGSTVRDQVKKLTASHEKIWQDFWSKSGIFLADPLLCNTWYRGLYFLRCVSKPGVVAPGLFASLITDRPAWHGDYHTNYNIQQTFWGCYAANHTELAEPYDRLITSYLPRGRWLAQKVFDMEGIYYPHVLFAYEPIDPAICKSPGGRQYIHHVWGFSIGVAGFTVQPLWWRYKYEPDPDYLRKTAYPALCEVALFYADFIEQCEKNGTSVVLAPSVSPEHWGWTEGLKRNRNCAFDIAMIRYTLKAAIEASKRMETDEVLVKRSGNSLRMISRRSRQSPYQELIKRFENALALLPDYPTTSGDEVVVVDVEDAPPITYNIAVPATPVFPCDVVTWMSPLEERLLFRRTIDRLKWNGNNSMVILGVARARLNMPDTGDWIRKELSARLRPNGTFTLNRRVPHHRFNDYGHYTEQFGATMAVSELLLQSVSDVIRVFPAWPKGKTARFTCLRAQGGFLVSASNRTRLIEIASTAGGTLRVHCPSFQAKVERSDKDGQKTDVKAAPDDRGIITVETEKGDTVTISY